MLQSSVKKSWYIAGGHGADTGDGELRAFPGVRFFFNAKCPNYIYTAKQNVS